MSGKKLAKGYKVIDGKEYYFSKTTGYLQKNVWRYVKLNGKKYKLYFGSNGSRLYDVTSKLPKTSTFLVEVNTAKNMVMIYARDGIEGYIIPVKSMICSCGMAGHSTKLGTYRLSRSGSWHTLKYNCYGQYCTRYSGSYMFHSVVYYRYGDRHSLQKAEYNKLGTRASHGCVRLQVADAKWIYDRAGRITVRLYTDAAAKYLLSRPAKRKIGVLSGGRYYDPTDPLESKNRT